MKTKGHTNGSFILELIKRGHCYSVSGASRCPYGQSLKLWLQALPQEAVITMTTSYALSDTQREFTFRKLSTRWAYSTRSFKEHANAA